MYLKRPSMKLDQHAVVFFWALGFGWLVHDRGIGLIGVGVGGNLVGKALKSKTTCSTP